MIHQSTENKLKRRGHHEGSFQKTKYGTWRAWVTLKSGKRLSKIFPTKTEARDWVQQKQMEVEIVPQAEVTFGDYITGWFELHSSQIADSTRCDYDLLINKYIIPGLGQCTLHELSRSVFDRFYLSLQEQEKPVGNTQIGYIHRVIRKSLNDGVQDRVLEFNPCEGAKTPKKPKVKKIVSPLTEEQALHLVEVSMSYSIGPLIYLALKTGMREGELFALKWVDINWVDQKIHVQRSIQKTLIDGHARKKLGPTKTLTSDRIFPVGAKTMEILIMQKNNVAIKKAICKKNWEENDFVFPTSVGTAMNQSNMRKIFLQVLGKAKIEPIRFHDLRHVAASIMLNHGIPLLTVSALLGHAQPSTTLNLYGHQFEASEKEAALIIDDVFSNVQPSQLPANFLVLMNQNQILELFKK